MKRKNKYLYLLLFIIFIVLGKLPLLSQTMFTGKVADENNEPIEFANVAIYSIPDSIFIRGGVTMKNGQFELELSTRGHCLVRVSFVGYQKYEQEITVKEENISLPVIILKEENSELGEITVTANRPVFSVKNGKLTARIENTLLSKEHSILDVLTQIPGVIDNRGVIEVFGGGQPVFYINNRRVRDMSEVTQLSVKNIHSIRLISNPGAQYDASVSAVIEIITIKKDEGMAIDLNAGFRQSEKPAHYEDIRINYKKGKLNASIYYELFTYRNETSQYIRKDLEADSLWQYTTNRLSLPYQQSNIFSASLDYDLSDKHSIGVRFNEKLLNLKDHSDETNSVVSNNGQYMDFITSSNYVNNINDSRINIFHNANWNRKITSALNADFIFYNNMLNQSVIEGSVNDERRTGIKNNSRYSIYAVQYLLKYLPAENQSFIVGLDFSMIEGKGYMIVDSSISEDLDYESNENKWAVFAEYDWIKNALSMNLGLRYEEFSSKYIDLITPENKTERINRNLFPSIRLSHAGKRIGNTLSFSVRAQQPQLSYLNNKTYYQNQFMYQQGNPDLKPQTSCILQWMAGYKFINFNSSFTSTDNYISNIYINQAGSNNIVSTWDNFDNARFIRATLNIRHAFKIWTHSLTIGFTKPFLENEYQGVVTVYDKPNYYLSSNNYIKLPGKYMLSLNYHYNRGGSQRILEFSPYQYFDIKVQKTFLGERLSVSAGARDLFRKLEYEENAQYNNIHFYQVEDYSSWNFFIDVIFRLNQPQKEKYRGKSAAKAETDRL